MTGWESWGPWEELYRKWEKRIGKERMALTYPTLKGLWQWFAREIEMRKIDPAEIDVESYLDPFLAIDENKEILRTIMLKPITDYESADMYEEAKALLEEQARTKYPEIIGTLEEKIMKLERTEKTSKSRYKKIKALELDLEESERLHEEEKRALEAKVAPVKVRVLRPFTEGILDYTVGSVLEVRDVKWILEKLRKGLIERVGVEVAVETKGPKKELTRQEQSQLKDEFQAALMSDLGRVPSNVMAEFRVALRNILFLSYEEALSEIHEKAKEIVSRETLRRRPPRPAVIPPPKIIHRVPEEKDDISMMVARIPPEHVPDEPLSPLPFARAPSSEEKKVLWDAFVYIFQEKGINAWDYRKIFEERIWGIQWKDWDTLKKKFDYLVDAIIKGEVRQLPPLFIWRGFPLPALMGTEASAWRMDREEQKADAIVHYTSVVIRNARNKIGVVPRIQELRELLEQAGILQVRHADINEAINQAYERRDSWFAGITMEELNEFLET